MSRPPAKVPRVGVFALGPPYSDAQIAAFRHALRWPPSSPRPPPFMVGVGEALCYPVCAILSPVVFRAVAARVSRAGEVV